MDYIESVIYKKTLSFISSAILDCASASPAGAINPVDGARHAVMTKPGFRRRRYGATLSCRRQPKISWQQM